MKDLTEAFAIILIMYIYLVYVDLKLHFQEPGVHNTV